VTRGAGFWPGGRERSVPPGFPGETGEPSSSATASAPGPKRKRKRPIGGWRPRPDLGIPDLGDDPTTEEPRPGVEEGSKAERSPFSERPPRKRAVPRAEARVAPAIAASRRAHPATRRLLDVWPGGRAGSLPPDFPGSGAGAGSGGKVAVEDPPDRILTLADTPSRSMLDESRLADMRRTTGEARSRWAITLPLRPPQRFNNIVGAVYAALADPLAADSAEAREQRAARVREVGLVTASTALVALLIYGIFPVRTFLDQRSNTAEAEERLEKLSEANERLEEEAEQLRDDEEIEMRARSDYGWVFPGEESYGVTPPPVAPTTTTTAP